MDNFINTVDSLGADVVENLLLTKELTEFSDLRLTSMGYYALSHQKKLKKVDLPLVSILEGYNFYMDTALEVVNLPSVMIIRNQTFDGCSSLKSLDLPRVQDLYHASLRNCVSLETLILRNKKEANLSHIENLAGTPIEAGTGYVYVPRTLADGRDGPATYAAATNWSAYAGQFRAIEDYPEITGG